MTFSPEELNMIAIGLALYREKLKKLLKASQEVKSAEKEIKDSFLKTDKLADKIMRGTQ